ncbi:MAG: glycosyltransferase [Bacteroidales bacterium]|nr:glycosyltransferase [Bacteroidales bacterium]
MKVAIVHDYIKEYGGAERVLEELHNMYPDSDVYTLVYLPKFLGPHRERFENWKIKTSFLQWIPFKGKLISLFRLIDPLVFKMFDLTKHDLIIVSAAGTYSGVNSFKKSKKSLHICYCHTPPRYLYGYATANKWTTNSLREFLLFLGQIPMHFIRLYDFIDAQKPDYFLANSKEIASRIEKFYRRKAKVIHPPIDIPNIKKPVQMSKRKFYLSGGRLARAKRFDLAVSACTKLNLPLKVFGREFAGYGNELKEIAGPTVEFLGEVSQKKKWELIKNAKAYISPSLQEDFGMLNLEVNAGGTPVIAYKSGGVLETVIDPLARASTEFSRTSSEQVATGILFDEPNVDSVIKAIKRFEKVNFKPQVLINHARRFSKERFEKEMRKYVSSIMN